MKNLIIDLDGTLTIDDKNVPYDKKRVNTAVVTQLRAYKEKGFNISIYTSRNMKTFSGDLEQIRAKTLPIIIEWLESHKIPYDSVIIGKPWCGEEGFYVDDRAVRPDEFATLSYEEICALSKIDSKNSKDSINCDFTTCGGGGGIMILNA
ncbi:MAG: HAD hydrolase family protein, partial [Helicobacter sp.]|nr:HAD hydrolase family protein [Helicobacter sp.]